MLKVIDIANAIEDFAPKCLQENYDNAGLQVGDPDMDVSAALLCLDVTEDVVNEALQRHCNPNNLTPSASLQRLEGSDRENSHRTNRDQGGKREYCNLFRTYQP